MSPTLLGPSNGPVPLDHRRSQPARELPAWGPVGLARTGIPLAPQGQGLTGLGDEHRRNGFSYRFWLHVVVTWSGFRSYLSDVYQFPAACGMSTETVRRWFEGSVLPHRKWIEAGQLPGGIGAFTPKAESWLQVQSDGTFLAKYQNALVEYEGVG